MKIKKRFSLVQSRLKRKGKTGFTNGNKVCLTSHLKVTNTRFIFACLFLTLNCRDWQEITEFFFFNSLHTWLTWHIRWNVSQTLSIYLMFPFSKERMGSILKEQAKLGRCLKDSSITCKKSTSQNLRHPSSQRGNIWLTYPPSG